MPPRQTTSTSYLTPAGCKFIRLLLKQWEAYQESEGKERPDWLPQEGPPILDATRYALIGLLNQHANTRKGS